MIPVAAFLAVSFITAWLYLGLSVVSKSHALLNAFRSAYPVEALAEGLTTAGRDPRKVIYFLSRRSDCFLTEKHNDELAAQRNSFVHTATGFLALHVGAMALLAVLLLAWP